MYDPVTNTHSNITQTVPCHQCAHLQVCQHKDELNAVLRALHQSSFVTESKDQSLTHMVLGHSKVAQITLSCVHFSFPVRNLARPRDTNLDDLKG